MKPTKRWVIRYTDGDGCPDFSWSCYAFDREHAEEKFLENDYDSFGDYTGWKILSIDRPRTPPR